MVKIYKYLFFVCLTEHFDNFLLAFTFKMINSFTFINAHCKEESEMNSCNCHSPFESSKSIFLIKNAFSSNF